MDKLDELVSEGRGDEEYTNIFNETLSELCVLEADTDFRNNSLSLVNKITKLLERLVDYRNIKPGDEHRNQKLSCIVNLMNFYKEIDHLNVYIRYIHKLFAIHEGAENYCEAANALLLYSDMLEWTDAILPPMENVYQSEKERDRKEYILKKSINYFDKGKAWEMGIILCKELGKQYEEETFEYLKLSDILQSQAQFYVKIIQELRFPRAYFKTGFFGKGFPLFLRNKSFVYQGNEYEKLNDFMCKLQEEFPNAQLMSTTNPPDDVILNSEGMHLQMSAVDPTPQEFFLFKDKIVPEKVYEYYKGNSVNTFIYNKAYHVGKKDKANEFASMWIERTSFITRDEFPGILKWSEVITSSKVEISPLENALHTVESKNKEIYGLINKYKENTNISISPLSMALNGVIDAAVMGGISNYQKAFFNDDYLIQHPEHSDFVTQLNTLIEDQIDVLREGLSLHSQRVTVDLKPFHEKMETCFLKLESDVFGKQEPSLPYNSDTQKALGTHHSTGTLDDPAKITQSLCIDIRSDRGDGRSSPDHFSPPPSPINGHSPHKKKGPKIFGFMSSKGKNNQSLAVPDMPAVPKKRAASFYPHSTTPQDPSIINQPLPPIPQTMPYDPIVDQVIPQDIYEDINSNPTNDNRTSKVSIQSDLSCTSSTDLDLSIADERSQGDDNTYLDISDVHSNPPAPDIPKPFKSNSNGPIPSVRKHPPPPVPTKAKRTMSTENLNKLDLTKSLQSNSSQENRTSRTFSVVDMRKYTVHLNDNTLPEIPPHTTTVQPPKRRTSLHKRPRSPRQDPATHSPPPPVLPPRDKSVDNFAQEQQQQIPPPIPNKVPPPVPQRPTVFP
eukprot:TRINITY_DN3023_c0_g1_i4.p1 TRINITY_DN3023_c0_g1~~TRINITY_DN3023_c0_g1_i4.p1  ORF type:complete len:841 (-),score=170.33 TRINITY_DN3023_c0_g1_i4:233-2755(-)